MNILNFIVFVINKTIMHDRFIYYGVDYLNISENTSNNEPF